MIGEHVKMAIQSGHKAILYTQSRTRGYNDRGTSQEVSQERKSGQMRRWKMGLGHHTILNMRNSRRKNPFFFFFFFVEGDALCACRDDVR
jgi:hypothetical protein